MRQCKNCNNNISDKKVFCNDICRNKYNIKVKYTTTTCDFCNKDFEMETRFFRRWLQGKQKTKCCSIDCHNKLIAKESSYKKKTGIYKVCPQCNKEFYVKNHLIEQKEFCSRECRDISRCINYVCQVCGKEHSTNLYQYTKYENHFCSKKCKDFYMNNIWSKSEEGKNHIQKISLLGFQSQLNNKLFQYTKPEKIMKNYLDSKDIIYTPQCFMHDKFFVDFYLNEYDMVIEIFGDYWHGNPIIYGNDIGLKPLNDKQVKQKKKDKSRISYLNKTHRKVIILWENDLLNNIKWCQEYLDKIIDKNP